MNEWRVEVEQPFFEDGWKRTLIVRSPWEWSLNLWAHINRPRNIRLGGGIWLREAWGMQGKFTAISVCAWCLAIGFGFREPPPPVDEIELDECTDETQECEP